MRNNLWVMFIISITTNIGMWFERFVIIATSLTRDFLPTSWGYFHPTWVDMCTFAGTIGLFLTLFLVFARFLPMIAISEVKGVLAVQKHQFTDAAELSEALLKEVPGDPSVLALLGDALMELGYTEEAAAFMNWIDRRCREVSDSERLQVLYGIDGRRDMREAKLDPSGAWRVALTHFG